MIEEGDPICPLMVIYFDAKLEEGNGGLGGKTISLSKGPEVCQEMRRQGEARFEDEDICGKGGVMDI